VTVFPDVAGVKARGLSTQRMLVGTWSAAEWAIRDNKLVADLPILTFGMILFLVLVFLLGQRHVVSGLQTGALKA